MKSIVQQKEECWFCKTTKELHDHHIFEGTANRRLSEKFGLKVKVCAFHHNLGGKYCVHQNKEMELELKVAGQTAFENKYPDLEFIKIFGRNYK